MEMRLSRDKICFVSAFNFSYICRLYMKNIVKKYCSAILVLWYCVSIIGFDVHTCNGSGRSFLANFISGMNCADIHPGHVCGISHDEPCGHAARCSHYIGCSGCCHSDASATEVFADDILACLSSEACVSSECCSDHYQVLSVTGLQQEDSHRHYDECHCGHCPCLAGQMSILPEVPLITRPAVFSGSVCQEPRNIDILASYGVWRI